MYFTIVFMKGYDPAVFHMIITHFERGPFWGLNARTPLREKPGHPGLACYHQVSKLGPSGRVYILTNLCRHRLASLIQRKAGSDCGTVR